MKGYRAPILSRLFLCNFSYIFAAACLQLLLFSYISQVYCGSSPTTILLSSVGRQDGDGIKARDGTDTVPPTHYFDDQNSNHLLRKLDGNGKKKQSLRMKLHGRGLIAGAIGSTPPKCVSKCSKCTPCKAVRVPIQPGRTKVSLMEYYPEAWRCKCKNKLYMP